MQCCDNDPDNFIEVWVEIRMWRRGGCSATLRPVAVPAVLVCDAAGDPVLTVEDNDGEALFYPRKKRNRRGSARCWPSLSPLPSKQERWLQPLREDIPLNPV